MIIRHVKIRNFRGIQNLDWHLGGRVLCLIGPSDATKTTILDAIEVALQSRSNAQFNDADFYNADISQPILIELTVGELPSELITEPEKFGLYQRGYKIAEPIADDPADDFERVITIQFNLDSALEPTWFVVKESQGEPKRIGWQDRERLGLARLGDDVERHLTWARGSALSKLTGPTKTTNQTFTEVARSARKLVSESNMEQLTTAAGKAVKTAKRLGIEFEELKPGLDLRGFSVGQSVLGLHQKDVPLRLWGLGSKRILALAAQQTELGQDSILLIDEIEHGLEPHRIRHILRRLSTDDTDKVRSRGQAIISSHSPSSVIALQIEAIRFVRSSQGTTTVTEVLPSFVNELQAIARTHSHAFFGRKLLICEGATEVGLCRSLEDSWATQNSGRHPTHVGFVAIDGKGCTVAPGIMRELRRIGYDAALLADTDKPLVPSKEELESENAPLFLWADNVCVEERLMVDLPLACVQQILDAAIDEYGAEPIRAHIMQFGNLTIPNGENRLSNWITPALSETALRSAIGKAAKNGKFGGKDQGWFKSVTMGGRLGEIVISELPAIAEKPAGKLLNRLVAWVYA